MVGKRELLKRILPPHLRCDSVHFNCPLLSLLVDLLHPRSCGMVSLLAPGWIVLPERKFWSYREGNNGRAVATLISAPLSIDCSGATTWYIHYYWCGLLAKRMGAHALALLNASPRAIPRFRDWFTVPSSVLVRIWRCERLSRRCELREYHDWF